MSWYTRMTPAASRSPCLRISSLKNSAGKVFYLASLYALDQPPAAGGQAQDLPLINQLPLGEKWPNGVQFNERNGSLAFRSEGEPWRATPWSLPAFHDMARDVFKPGKGVAAIKG